MHHDRSGIKRSEPGYLVATLLSGSWRDSPPSLFISPTELSEIAPLLLKTGTGPLAWWRIRYLDLSASQAAFHLRQAYRLQTLHARLAEGEIQDAITVLRSAGVEPVLAKGWAAARLYPEPGLRPYGDIDLYVRPEDYSSAEAVLFPSGARVRHVDLHRGFADLCDRSPNDLYARSQLVRLGDVDARVLAPEDHLCLLCLHLLRHGIRSPLWLCDIGAALESPAHDFDWDYFWTGIRRRSDWVACVLEGSHQLLGSKLDHCIIPRFHRPPRWFLPSVLRQWGADASPDHETMLTHLRRRSGILRAARRRWPNPIEATFRCGMSLSRVPRFPFQLADYLVRGLLLAARIVMLTVGLPIDRNKSCPTPNSPLRIP